MPPLAAALHYKSWSICTWYLTSPLRAMFAHRSEIWLQIQDANMSTSGADDSVFLGWLFIWWSFTFTLIQPVVTGWKIGINYILHNYTVATGWISVNMNVSVNMNDHNEWCYLLKNTAWKQSIYSPVHGPVHTVQVLQLWTVLCD